MQKTGLITRLMAPRRPAVIVASLAVALAFATLARWLIDQGRGGAPFAFYFPIVLVASLAFGWRWSIVAILASGVCASLFFIEPFMALRVTDIPVALPFLLSCAGIAYFGDRFRHAIQEAEDRAEKLDRFNRELHHRATNLAAVLRVLMSRARKADDAAEGLAVLEGRVNALFSSSQLLGFGTRPTCNLAELVRILLAPFDLAQFDIAGPECSICESAAVPLAMALHELATNATKYGALSVPAGRVCLDWTMQAEGAVTLSWREENGPAVAPPVRAGLGSRLLRPFGGLRRVEVEYPPRGVTCTLCADAARP